MAAALAELKEEWRHFREDKPGERFRNHRDRMKKKSKKHLAVAIALGVLLVAGGVVLLFIPGPGSLLIVFGVALIGSHNKRLSRLLDRGEPKLRDLGHRIAGWWRSMSQFRRGLVISSGIIVVTLLLVATGTFVGAYLL